MKLHVSFIPDECETESRNVQIFSKDNDKGRKGEKQIKTTIAIRRREAFNKTENLLTVKLMQC